MPLDFSRAAALFMGSEDELARALDIAVGDVRSMRANPQHAGRDVMRKFGEVLRERGGGMKRVGEMLLEDYGSG